MRAPRDSSDRSGRARARRGAEVQRYLDRFVDTYSLGTRQKLCVLLALLGEPALVVLDEAFNGLDPASALIVKRHLQQRLAANRCGVLLATHSLDIVEHYADKAALLLDGRIVRGMERSEIAAVREQGADGSKSCWRRSPRAASYAFRRALTTFGSPWIRAEHARQLLQVVHGDAQVHVRDAVALVGDGVHRLNVDLRIGEHGADVAHQSATVERAHVDVDRERTIAAACPIRRRSRARDASPRSRRKLAQSSR